VQKFKTTLKSSVSLSSGSNMAIVGGPGDNNGQDTWSGGVWTQRGNKLVGTGASGAAQQGHLPRGWRRKATLNVRAIRHG
jgi:hypothetical protein